ncbi:MAG: hypothetical protein GXO66_08675 [Euryarchaeota archaeon]|nr:hypothetical protein [Euryarchaeota archaeon]
MLGKTYILLALGIAVLFASVMYAITLSTGRLMDTQTELLRQRIQGELSGEVYAQRSAEAERSYRQEVADALERLAEKFGAVAELINQTAPELNATRNLSILSRNLSEAIEGFRSGG